MTAEAAAASSGAAAAAAGAATPAVATARINDDLVWKLNFTMGGVAANPPLLWTADPNLSDLQISRCDGDSGVSVDLLRLVGQQCARALFVRALFDQRQRGPPAEG